MAADVPVLAYAAAAVPDTLGGAGVQFAPKDLEYAAELLGALAFDDDLRAERHRRTAPPARRFRRRAHHARADRRCIQQPLVKIAFIIQRYGAEVLGGSEHLCRLVAERLAAQPRRRRADHLRARLRHVEERVSRRRRPHPRRHGAAVRQRAHARHRRVQQLLRLDLQQPAQPRRRDGVAEAAGPVVPRRSSSTCGGNQQQYDVLIFFTYLYAPTVLGLEVAPQRSILVSTAHDEPAIRLEIFKDVFSKPAALCYLTESERRFVQQQFRRAAAARRRRRRRRRSPAAAAVPAHAAPPPTTTRRRLRADDRRTPQDDDGAARDFPSHLHRARRRVPPPPPALRPDRCSTAGASIRARAARS